MKCRYCDSWCDSYDGGPQFDYQANLYICRVCGETFDGDEDEDENEEA